MAVFEVAIWPHRDSGTRFRVDVVRSEVGEASTMVELELAALSGKRAQVQQALLASAVRTSPLVQDVGAELFTALLGSGAVAGRYRSAVDVARARDEELRLVVRVESPLLAGLPWEAMYDSELHGYVCRQRQLVRHVAVPSLPFPLLVPPPLRVLGVVSAPRGLPALNAARERAQLERALERPIRDGFVEVHWAAAATWAELQDLLMDGPWHVLHYIGHGAFDPVLDQGVLALEHSGGGVDRVDAARLADLLGQACPMPRLVVLNSCSGAATGGHDLFSGTAATLVRAGVSAAVAMQYEISDGAAVAFARGFYAAVARGRGVDQAVTAGRVAVLGTSPTTLEWVNPVLYLRGERTHLFDVAARPAATVARSAVPSHPQQPSVVVIAPSKAGRSTLINAIIGRELLPARPQAMTTLPTRILLTDGPGEPRLTLSEHDAMVLAYVAGTLRPDVAARFESLTDEYRHLGDLLVRLRDGRLPVRSTYTGTADIRRGLTDINDLVRLAQRLHRDRDMIDALDDVPALRTSSWLHPQLGQFSCIDMPGPDEGIPFPLARDRARLLRTSDAVLLVLDFGNLGSNVEWFAKRLLEQVGPDRLLVVVNKVDQRRRGDLDRYGVRDFVRTALGSERVFETWASLAFVGARALAEIRREGAAFDVRKSPAAAGLINTVYPFREDAAEALRDWTPDRLTRHAQRAWDKSGVPELLAALAQSLADRP
ncbi:CHAT domain-containing protein [Dactylosporangium sp. AC04546]|uniref:CHAT domain-containing protein n=1 Tax=Dactylosporangium sp. AC04546 TaxID=2862460 RepID=UPI001EDF760F|nr:CHAT domain-containing protein [Dactylosporangium sp. AC04546]WVK87480.1 CHAT domain-containing protein [Dactylosporangium sp. AC04546]